MLASLPISIEEFFHDPDSVGGGRVTRGARPALPEIFEEVSDTDEEEESEEQDGPMMFAIRDHMDDPDEEYCLTCLEPMRFDPWNDRTRDQPYWFCAAECFCFRPTSD